MNKKIFEKLNKIINQAAQFYAVDNIRECRRGNIWNALLKYAHDEYIAPNAAALLYQDGGKKYDLFKVAELAECLEQLSFIYDKILRPSSFCLLTGITSGTLRTWEAQNPTQYKRIATEPGGADAYNIYNSDIGVLNTDIENIYQDNKDINTDTEDISQVIESNNNTPLNNNINNNSLIGSNNSNSKIVSISAKSIIDRIKGAHAETVTNKMQGGDGNTVGYITEYNAVSVRYAEPVTAEVLAISAEDIATRYGITADNIQLLTDNNTLPND